MADLEVLHPLHELLRSTTVSALMKERDIISVSSDAAIDEALRTLAEHRLLSVPVRVDPGEGQADDTPFLFLDIRDVLNSFMQEMGDQVLAGTSAMLRRMRMLEELGMAFAERPVLGLPVLGTDGVVLPLEGTLGRSLGDMLREVFLRATPPPPRSTAAGSGDRPTKTRAVTHRVGLLASPGDAGLAAVVTQSDVMRWLGTALKSLPEVAGAPVSSLGLGVRGVVGVPADTPALDALQEMRRIGVSALAVLAGDGRLIGNFSASDLRTMLAEHFGALALPVGEYLAREHGTEFAGYTAQTEEETEGDEGAALPSHDFLSRRPSKPGAEVGQDLVTCRADDRFSVVVHKLIRNGLHRLYVCDEGQRPVGVITLTDILGCIAPPAR